MEFMLGFLGGFASWTTLIILLECAAIITFIEHGKNALAGISVLITLALLYWIGGMNPFIYIIEHPFGTISLIVAYLAIGIVWSIFRLDRLAKKWRRAWDESSEAYDRRRLFNERPSVKNNKEKIVTWMAFWPLSALWWALADLVVDLMNTIYEMMSATFTKVIERHMVDVQDPTPQTDKELAPYRGGGGTRV